MNEDLYIEYLQKELSGTITEKERIELDQWKHSSEENSLLANRIYEAWELSDQYGANIKVDLDRDFGVLMSKISKTDKRSSIFPRLWIGMAASILLLTSVFFLLRPTEDIIIISTSDNYAVTLPDGSKLLLSEGTKISYKEKFAEGRSVTLSGAAYWDVKHDANMPFHVISPNLRTSVLGTKFFINDIKDIDNPEVQLLEGKISVTRVDGSQEYILVPDQRLVMMEGTLKRFDQLSLQNFSWYYDSLRFEQTILKEVIFNLEAHFGTSIELESQIQDCSFTGNFTNQSIKEILESIVTLFGAELIENELKYVILGGQCE